MDDAMRERELIAIALGEIANDKDGSKLGACRDLMRAVDAFASSEADRREREVVEAATEMWCELCDFGLVPATRHDSSTPCRWFHDMEEHGLKECEADDIREWSYQRQQREKGEG